MDGEAHGEAEELRLQAREALDLYGSSASHIISRHADALFFTGDVLAAFYCRLIVGAIEDLEGKSGV